jgi:1,4-dihydroxy-2-naphthoate octaprenyltransferase
MVTNDGDLLLLWSSAMAQLAAFWSLSRPSQVLAVVLVFLMGVLGAYALENDFSLGQALWAFAVTLPLTVSIHYANEYADVETDALTERTSFSGGSGVLPAGIVSRMAVLRWAVGLLLLSMLLQGAGWAGGALSWQSGVVWLAIAAGGWAYSMPPVALSWRGWGELDNALLGGVIMPVYGYLSQSTAVPLNFYLSCLPFTIIVFVNLLATTWPDRLADAAVGKFTLVTRLRRRTLRGLFLGLCVAAYGLLAALLWVEVPAAVVVGGMLALPFSGWAWLRYTKQESPAPAVGAMVIMMVGTLGGWVVAGPLL